ncbi:DUF3783 domain-containing protein [Schwartzia succinivorans]|jgi:hypothetical protein|uniref:DUF3783 domain-containing protein n=1 Tax=Schwartzia succinivorans DSM 10502 TaxID=1123243 RepID=A0A1M5ASG6_9FIRM|nr:DUF3783 domain-containing protein [Schwartzia succinivorans]SHF32892.1 protein of unknown function [Schwartzia succinivorans DSM 10502]
MAQFKEKVLLYNFTNDETVNKIKSICRKMNIENQIVPFENWNQKIGFLLGRRGFLPAKDSEGENFNFSDEVLIFVHLKDKRLDKFLSNLKLENVPVIKYKAVVTPFNIMWSLRRLCETMHKEHGAVQEGKKTTDG